MAKIPCSQVKVQGHTGEGHQDTHVVFEPEERPKYGMWMMQEDDVLETNVEKIDGLTYYAW
jgi:hypothetical protein